MALWANSDRERGYDQSGPWPLVVHETPQ